MNWERGRAVDTQSLPPEYQLLRVRWRSESGRFKIAERIDEPGFKGYPLFEYGVHVETHRLLRDAKAAAEERA